MLWFSEKITLRQQLPLDSDSLSKVTPLRRLQWHTNERHLAFFEIATKNGFCTFKISGKTSHWKKWIQSGKRMIGGSLKCLDFWALRHQVTRKCKQTIAGVYGKELGAQRWQVRVIQNLVDSTILCQRIWLRISESEFRSFGVCLVYLVALACHLRQIPVQVETDGSLCELQINFLIKCGGFHQKRSKDEL